jgi:PAS domain S-box-containing protein
MALTPPRIHKPLKPVDVTADQLKKLVRQSREFLALAKYSADAMISFDKHRVIRAWNVGAERMFGWTQEEVIGQAIDFLMPADAQHVEEGEYLHTEACEKGFVRNHETIRLHKNGTPIQVSLTFTVIKDRKGKPSGYSSVYRDITMQKRWEKELQDRFERLHDAYLEMGKMRRYVDYVVDLLDLGIGINPGANIPQFIASAILMFAQPDAVVLRVYDEKKDCLTLASAAGGLIDWNSKGSIAVTGSLAESAFQTRRPLKVMDITQEPLYSSPGFARKNDLRSLLLIPLLVNQKLIGTISVYISSQKSLDVLDHEFIPIFAKQAALVLSNIKK